MSRGPEQKLRRQPGIKTDIAVIGSGIAGLTTAELLTRNGYSVTVVELSPRIANGATVRNEGRLLTGSYHAVAIDNDADARHVTTNSLRSYEHTLRNFPEVVEEPGLPTYAVFQSPTLAERAVTRWGAFGVPHTEIPIWSLHQKVPQIEGAPIVAAFEVEDRSIDTRKYVRSLLEVFENRGGRVLTNTLFVPTGPNTADLETFDEVREINAQAFILTAGTGIKDIMEYATGKPFPMRYFKSHLLVTERLTGPNIFYIDEGNAGIMNHGATSIVGLNKDALQIDDPDNYDVIPEKVILLRDALRRMVPNTSIRESYPYACLKVDVQRYSEALQSLGINFGYDYDLPTYIWAVPGKMSAAPELAQKIWLDLQQRGNTPEPTRTHSLAPDAEPPHTVYQIQERPCDVFTRVLPEWKRQQGGAAQTETA